MRAVVVTVGSELLAGRTVDTNFPFLARALGEVGVRVIRQTTVGDERAAMLEVIRAALAESELVVVSGGLGPTADDLTRDVVAELAGTALIEDEEVVARLASFYARRRRPFTAVARRQALLPAGVATLPNPVGLAPGLWLERKGRIVCALPGVPSELEAMTRESLLPRLRARVDVAVAPVVETLRTIGIPEGDIAQRIEDEGIDLGGVELAYLPHVAGVDLRLAGTGRKGAMAVERVASVLSERFADAIYARGEDTIEEVVNGLLRERGLKLAVAESCTGGLVGYRLTRVSGSSEVFVGGVVAYADRAKISELGVPEELLAAHGAVSAEAAAAMAAGACALLSADVGLAVTGIAGPGGGSEAKPVGLVYIGVAHRGGASATRRLDLAGGRDHIREWAAALALECLRRFLLGTLGSRPA